jgi:hypothetical protein
MTEALRLVHHHPGRIRARARVFLDASADHPAVVAAREEAATAPIRTFHHFAMTGSILIEYAPGALDPDELLERIAASIGCSGVVDDTTLRLQREELVEGVIDTFRSLNALALEATGGRADLREIIPGMLTLASVAAFLSGGGGRGYMPRWEVALWFAQTAFHQWHPREIERQRCEVDVPPR